MGLAELVFGNNGYSIKAPLALVEMIEMLRHPTVDQVAFIASMHGRLPFFLEWGVPCAICGEMVALADLQYWSVAHQVAFKGIEQAVAFAIKNGYPDAKSRL